jgi:hypothetical protein
MAMGSAQVVNVGQAINHQVVSLGMTQGETIVTPGVPLPPQITGVYQGVSTGALSRSGIGYGGLSRSGVMIGGGVVPGCMPPMPPIPPMGLAQGAGLHTSGVQIVPPIGRIGMGASGIGMGMGMGGGYGQTVTTTTTTGGMYPGGMGMGMGMNGMSGYGMNGYAMNGMSGYTMNGGMNGFAMNGGMSGAGYGMGMGRASGMVTQTPGVVTNVGPDGTVT